MPVRYRVAAAADVGNIERGKAAAQYCRWVEIQASSHGHADIVCRGREVTASGPGEAYSPAAQEGQSVRCASHVPERRVYVGWTVVDVTEASAAWRFGFRDGALAVFTMLPGLLAGVLDVPEMLARLYDPDVLSVRGGDTPQRGRCAR